MMTLVDVVEEVEDFAEIGVIFGFSYYGKPKIICASRSVAAYNSARDFCDDNALALKLIGRMLRADLWVDPWVLRQIDFMKYRVEAGEYGPDPGLRVIRPPKKRVKG